MKTATLLTVAGVGAVIYWLTRPKPVVTITEVPPPNSGPVVNGLGNIFNQTKIMQRRAPPVAIRTGSTSINRYQQPVRPQFSTPLFFR